MSTLPPFAVAPATVRLDAGGTDDGDGAGDRDAAADQVDRHGGHAGPGAPRRTETPGAVASTAAAPVAAAGAAGMAPPPATARGGQRTLGRYLVLSELGVGGMGRVLAAYDPELDRRVALKLLHAGAGVGTSKLEEHTVRLDADGAARNLDREQLLTEARAMARLSHPNLVHVYEVGEVEQQVYLAMEHVAGETFALWLGRRARAVPELVHIFTEIGRGLAAIHAAGMVHGDVKPNNVLVEPSGRPRLVDFGLARLLQPAASSSSAEPIMGTPGYIAPERLARRALDARSDQYSFAVMFRHALASAQHKHLPRWLERCLVRAEATEPTARFPSMDALLTALRRGRLARQRLAVGAGVAGAVLGALLVGRSAATRGPTCDGGEAKLAGAWDAEAAQAVRAAMLATGKPYAELAYGRAAAQLDRYRAAWSTLHREVCVATAAGVQSAQLLDRKMLCLERRLAGLRQAAAVLRQPENLARAAEVTSGLAPLSSCADAEALLAVVPMPDAPAQRAAAQKLEARLAAGEVDLRAGHIDDARRLAEAALAEAQALGYAPPIARAGALLGRALDELGHPAEAEAALYAAQTAAVRGRDDALAAAVQVELVGVIGLRQSRVPEARLLARLTEATLGRADAATAALERPRLLARLGVIAQVQAELPAAERYLTEARALLRAALPADDPRLAKAEDLLGSVFLAGGRYEEALTQYQRALQISERALGPEHPQVADILNNLAVCYGNLHRPEKTREMYLRALAIIEKLPEHRSTPAVLSNLGNLERDAGHFELALRYHERALAQRRQRLGERHAAVALSLEGLGSTLLEAGQLARALEVQRQALAIRQAVLDPAHPQVAASLRATGEALRRAGRAREGLSLLESAARIAEAAFGKDHANTRRYRAYVALSALDLGRSQGTAAALTAALADLPAADPERVELLFGLARALGGGGAPSAPSRQRALDAAREALTLARQLRPAAVPALGRWLAQHGAPPS